MKYFTLCLTIIIALPAHAADIPGSIRNFKSEVVVENDGRSVQITRVEIAVNTDAVARDEAQQIQVYNADLELVELVEAYTVKPDGNRLPVLPDAVRVQLSPVSTNLPEYNSRKQVTAVMPNVSGGDILSLTWKRTTVKPVFPGHFSFIHLFTRAVAWDDAEISISVPSGMHLNTEEHGPTHTETEDTGRHVHKWQWSASSSAQDAGVLSLLDRAPRIFASTFTDWPAFSSTYAKIFEPKTVVTPKIQALADEVAAGAPNRREEARLLYEWVSRRVRWVAIYVGDGTYVPHSAERVLATRYGDCKDQVALLTSLLRARGIEAVPVLLNLTPTYTLSGPAVPAAFNHVITYLPEWDIYADTTAFGVPFGSLPVQEYGKPTLQVLATGASVTRMAAMSPDLLSTKLRTAMVLSKGGRVTGISTTNASGPYAALLRQAGNRISIRGSERSAAEQLKGANQSGTGTFKLEALDAMGSEYHIDGSFMLDAQPGWLDGDGFTLPTGLRLLPRPGDGLLGPLSQRGLSSAEPTPCYPGRQEEELTLELPPGIRLSNLPRPRKLENEAFEYNSEWTTDGNVVRVIRRVISRIAQPLCEGPLRSATAKALNEIRRDLGTQITLEKVN